MSAKKKKDRPMPHEVSELKKFLCTYKKLCLNTNSQVNPWIIENAKNCIDNYEILTKIILDFSNFKDTPSILFAIIIAAIRQVRYKYIKHIYVWNYPMSYENVAMLAAYMENAAYKTYTLQLMDCLLTSNSLERLTREIPSCEFLSDIGLDYNDIGDSGCELLAKSLEKNKIIKCLRLNFCGLSAQSGKFLGQIIATSSISELYVDGNSLQCKGVLQMLKCCADQAKAEIEAEEKTMPEPKPKPKTKEKKPDEKKKTSDQKKKKKRKKKKKEAPVTRIGPWIETLHIADNGVDVHSLEGPSATLHCIQVFKTLIMHSFCLKELNLSGNEIGNLASLLLLAAMEARKAQKLPPLKLQSTPKIQVPKLFPPLQKLSSGKLPKKKRKKKKGKNK